MRERGREGEREREREMTKTAFFSFYIDELARRYFSLSLSLMRESGLLLLLAEVDSAEEGEYCVI